LRHATPFDRSVARAACSAAGCYLPEPRDRAEIRAAIDRYVRVRGTRA